MEDFNPLILLYKVVLERDLFGLSKNRLFGVDPNLGHENNNKILISK